MTDSNFRLESVASPASDSTAVPSPFQQGIADLHTTARWIVTALAGVGGVLVAGVPLAGIGHLSGLAAEVIALSGLAVALIAIGIMIPTVSKVFTTPYITLANLIDREMPRRPGESTAAVTEILKLIQDNGEELFRDEAADLGILYRRLERANDQLRSVRHGERQANTRHDISMPRLTEDQESGTDKPSALTGKTSTTGGKGPLPEAGVATPERAIVGKSAEHKLADALPTIETLRATAARVVDFANYEDTRRRFLRLYPRLALASLVAVTGVVLYTLEVSRPAPLNVITKPIPVILSLPHDAYLYRVLGSKCRLDQVAAVAESGSLARPNVVIVPTETCRAARFLVPPSAVVIPGKELPTLPSATAKGPAK